MGQKVWKRPVTEVTIFEPSTGETLCTSTIGDRVEKGLLPFEKAPENAGVYGTYVPAHVKAAEELANANIHANGFTPIAEDKEPIKKKSYSSPWMDVPYWSPSHVGSFFAPKSFGILKVYK
jgi:hypothetical protein